MIAIKGMEMPSCCLWDCPLAREDGGACQLEDVRTSDKERPINCPLVEIVTCKDCNNHGISKEYPDIDGARYCSTLHTYTGYDFYCADAERKE